MKFRKIYQVVVVLTMAYLGFGYQAVAKQTERLNFKLAFSKKKRGNIQVRKEPRPDAEIIGEIAQDVFIHCVPDMTKDWWFMHQTGIQYSKEYSKIDWVPPFQGKGYINRHKIQLLDDFNYLDKHQFVLKILTTYQAIVEKFNLNQDQHGGITKNLIDKVYAQYHELKYIPTLPYIEELVCKYNDITLLNKFIEIMIATERSADERPSCTLGRIYDNNRKLIKKIILEQPNKGRESLINALCFYFCSSDSRTDTSVLNETHYKYHTHKLRALLKKPA